MSTRNLLLATTALAAAAAGCTGGPGQDALYSETRNAHVMITPLYWDEYGVQINGASESLPSEFESALTERMNQIGWSPQLQYIFQSLQRQAWHQLDESIVAVGGMEPLVGEATVDFVDINYFDRVDGPGRPGKAINFHVTTGHGDLAASADFSVNFVDLASVYGHPLRIAPTRQPSNRGGFAPGFDFNLLYNTRGYYSDYCTVMRSQYDALSDAYTGQGAFLEQNLATFAPQNPDLNPVSPLAAFLDEVLWIESYWIDNAGFRLSDINPFDNPDENIADASGNVPNHVKLQLRCNNQFATADLIMRVDFIIE